MDPNIHKQRIQAIREKLDDLCMIRGAVSKETAIKFIQNSTWWLTHVHGPVRAPGHSNRLYGNNGNWKIDFGANTFMVAAAVCRCRKAIEQFIEMGTPEHPGDLEKLRTELKRAIRGAVNNYSGDEYYIYGSLAEDEMVFGAQAINTSDFINTIFRIVPIRSLGSGINPSR